MRAPLAVLAEVTPQPDRQEDAIDIFNRMKAEEARELAGNLADDRF
jgi:hypothetical protein